MKRVAMFLTLLVASTALVGGEAKGDKAKCLENCKSGCQKMYAQCMKNATTDSKKSACKTSLDGCNSNCVNKACQ